MSKETQNTEKAQNGNDFIADVSSSSVKKELLIAELNEPLNNNRA